MELLSGARDAVTMTKIGLTAISDQVLYILKRASKDTRMFRLTFASLALLFLYLRHLLFRVTEFHDEVIARIRGSQRVRATF
jgi:uncharacterized membrane protein